LEERTLPNDLRYSEKAIKSVSTEKDRKEYIRRTHSIDGRKWPVPRIQGYVEKVFELVQEIRETLSCSVQYTRQIIPTYVAIIRLAQPSGRFSA
jgi:hypothetical protein